MPSFHEEFGILTIGDRLPARGKNLLDDRFRENLVGGYSRYSIHCCSERFGGAERVCCVVASNVHPDRLRIYVPNQSRQNQEK